MNGRKMTMVSLALLGAGCWFAADAGAAGIDKLTGTRCPDGVALCYVPDKAENAESPQIAIYFDTDSNDSTGFKTGGIGAEYKYSAGKLSCYTGDGESAEWDDLPDAEIAKALRNGRCILFFSNKTLELGDRSPVKIVVRVGDGASAREVAKQTVAWKKSGTEKLRFRRSGKRIEYLDPAGDVSPACRIDFIKCFVMPHPKKANTLMFGFTSDFPIVRNKLAYHLRLMLRIGDGPGANANGEIFDYMIESPNKLLRYVGTKSGQWKWQMIGRVPVRFTKQWCEMDLPLDMLPEKPASIKFRFNIEHSDFAPDQRFQIPEYKVN